MNFRSKKFHLFGYVIVKSSGIHRKNNYNEMDPLRQPSFPPNDTIYYTYHKSDSFKMMVIDNHYFEKQNKNIERGDSLLLFYMIAIHQSQYEYNINFCWWYH